MMTTTNPPWSRSPDAEPEPADGDGIVVTFVVAVAENGIIGRDGGLPWRLSSDLRLFRRLTMGKPIIMGRRTWQSLPKRPLDGRDNIVISRDPNFAAVGALVVGDAEAAVKLGRELAQKRGVGEIAVIGGASVYKALLPEVERIYWTVVHGDPAGDTTFPDFHLENWQLVQEECIERGPNDEFAATLRVLKRPQNAAPQPGDPAP